MSKECGECWFPIDPATGLGVKGHCDWCSWGLVEHHAIEERQRIVKLLRARAAEERPVWAEPWLEFAKMIEGLPYFTEEP